MAHHPDRNRLALLIFVKHPEPGKVKTRLASAIGAELAAQLYSEFIRATFSFAQQIEAAARFVTFTPAEKEQALREHFPGPFQWFAQIDSADLGARIQHAIRRVQQAGYSHVLTIGTDSPSLPTKYLDQAAAALETHDLVLGPATDGGYYLIGLKSAPPPELFTGIDWSTERVLHQTLQRAEQLRMSVHLLPSWYDVDDLITLRRFCNENKLPPDLWQKRQAILWIFKIKALVKTL
ncbi:MAG: TIGR04282 family arsenosugar biosynthesis glycosyltransferase [bacterium]